MENKAPHPEQHLYAFFSGAIDIFHKGQPDFVMKLKINPYVDSKYYKQY